MPCQPDKGGKESGGGEEENERELHAGFLSADEISCGKIHAIGEPTMTAAAIKAVVFLAGFYLFAIMAIAGAAAILVPAPKKARP